MLFDFKMPLVLRGPSWPEKKDIQGLILYLEYILVFHNNEWYRPILPGHVSLLSKAKCSLLMTSLSVTKVWPCGNHKRIVILLNVKSLSKLSYKRESMLLFHTNIVALERSNHMSSSNKVETFLQFFKICEPQTSNHCIRKLQTIPIWFNVSMYVACTKL